MFDQQSQAELPVFILQLLASSINCFLLIMLEFLPKKKIKITLDWDKFQCIEQLKEVVWHQNKHQISRCCSLSTPQSSSSVSQLLDSWDLHTTTLMHCLHQNLEHDNLHTVLTLVINTYYLSNQRKKRILLLKLSFRTFGHCLYPEHKIEYIWSSYET